MNQLFSMRMGYVKPKVTQFDGMDTELKVRLWNAMTFHKLRMREDHVNQLDSQLHILGVRIWMHFLVRTYDSCPKQHGRVDDDGIWVQIRKWYSDKDLPFHSVYDFFEFVAQNHQADDFGENLEMLVNQSLEDSLSGYRMVCGKFAPITNSEEIAEVNEALAPKLTALQDVATHLAKALEHLSDKVNPDYVNSIKESITAVEFVCKKVSGLTDKTLFNALEKTVKELCINSNIADSMFKLWEYTNTAGIRHASTKSDKAAPNLEDARYMFITCSAFINLVTAKAIKTGKLPAV